MQPEELDAHDQQVAAIKEKLADRPDDELPVAIGELYADAMRGDVASAAAYLSLALGDDDEQGTTERTGE